MEVKSKNKLKALREERGWKGPYVAEKINISAQYYYDLEKGDKRLNEDILNALADLYDVSIDYILGRTPDKQYRPYDLTAHREDQIFIELDPKAKKSLAEAIKYMRKEDSKE